MLGENLADVFKAFIEKVLLVVVRHPLGKNRAAAAYDACDALRNHRQILNEYAGVDGHVVHALLGLFLDDFEHDVAIQVFDALHARDGFINRHGADRNRRVAQDGFANLVNVAAGREIHYGVGAIVNGRVQFLQFLIDVRGDGGVADVRIDLAERGDADRHRLEFGMVDVRRDDHASASDFVADEFRGLLFPVGDVLHLFGDYSAAGISHLGEVSVGVGGPAFCDPFGARLGDRTIAVGPFEGSTVRRSHSLHRPDNLKLWLLYVARSEQGAVATQRRSLDALREHLRASA